MNATGKRIILAGLGPHARRIYYPLLEKYTAQYNISIPLVIDLEDQRGRVEAYLAGRALQPERVFFASARCRQRDCLDEDTRIALAQALAGGPIDGIIIATEPKAHKPYLAWALERDVDVLLDKPITAPVGLGANVEAGQQIFLDYLELAALLARSRSNFIVQTQRRSHKGYVFIKDYLADFVQTYHIPVSYMDIYHADGMWTMPAEIFSRENHPYKYGYGKLMHSGYHFVDLFAWLTEVNFLLERKQPDHADLFVKRFGPYDFLHQFEAEDYQLLLGTDKFDHFFDPDFMKMTRNFGEIDAFILCQLKRGEATVTTASINLQQNSFGRRAWTEPREDVYKGNGRVRHERVNIQVANLLNIQVHSYQSYEVQRRDIETEGAGHEDHFDVFIFRNNGVVGGEPLEKFTLGELSRQQHEADPTYLGHNESAREVHFLDFLNRRPGASHFASHRMTNWLLAHIYECIAREREGRVPQMFFSLADATHDYYHRV